VTTPLVDKYEQILAADPRSRIFVELARALVERGDLARAAEVCRNGLTHHPSSILGRVIWGRALLESGDSRAAEDQFEIAIGLDPANPYAYNLVGEALVKTARFREALPILKRAAELQPADPAARAALLDAQRRAGSGTVPAMAALSEPAPGAPALPENTAPAPAQEQHAPRSPPQGGAATRLAIPVAAAAAGEPPEATTSSGLDAEGPGPGTGPRALSTDLASPGQPFERLHPSPDEAGPSGARTPASEASEVSGPEASGSGRPGSDAPGSEAPGSAASGSDPEDSAEATEAAPPEVPAGSPGPPRAHRPPGPRTLLRLIPPAATVSPGDRAVVTMPDAAEAARIAADYERNLREQAAQSAAQAPPPPRRRRALLAAVALVLVGSASAAAYLYVQERTRTEEAGRAVQAAQVGLARDTKASLDKASEVLASVRTRLPSAPALQGQVLSLAAQVAALRAVDHGDAAARVDAAALADDPASGDGGLAARYLLADLAPARSAAEATVLAARPGDAPLLQRLAGRILVGRRELEAGRGRLRIATQASPPLLGALADLGDSYLAAGDAEAALPFFEAALSAHPTHPRSVIGAAEARLALERPLEASRQELAAVERDPGSSPPLASRLRFELAAARVEAASGDPAGAARRLALAAGALGDSAGLEAARAELLLGARSFEPAEEAAAKAVRLEPRSPEYRVLLARARLGLHRHGPALQALQGPEDRGVWLVRGEAYLGLGQAAPARAALEKTVRQGKMPTEAATWYALSDLALGRTDAAVALLDKLAGSKTATALVHAAHGRALQAARRPDEALAACRLAAEKAPRDPAGPLCLGRVLLAQGKPAQAIEPLETAVALDRLDPEAPRLLEAARAPPTAPPRLTPARPGAKPAAKPAARPAVRKK
jgi:tetratricopeptide (TPR) repeat protein